MNPENHLQNYPEGITKKRSEREKMLAGEKYQSSDPELNLMRQRSLEAVMRFNTGVDKSPENIFLQKFENLVIVPPFHTDYGEHIKLGKNVFINFNCTFLPCALIEIGDNCFIGPHVQLYTAFHPLDPEKRNRGINIAKPIKIGANCWLGGGTIVLPGVEIGEGTTIGAGSVVTKSIPANCLAVGDPCRIIRYLKNE